MTLAALGVLVSLGVWQLQRSEWKTALIAAVEARMASAPLTLEAALAGGLTDAEFRKVRIAGVFDHAKELRLFTQRQDEGVGYAILTPLTRADGATLLVERGFVPQVLAEPSARKEGQAEGVVTVTGWIRLKDEPRG
ncbi:MAG: SURF1 family protein, partial [Alphaproteobacteria bacterium]|nr:SURF1 family protein [Alphaproteobacteria bacterium]